MENATFNIVLQTNLNALGFFLVEYSGKLTVYVSVYVCKSCLVISNSLHLPWTVAHQAPLSMEFSRQEYWSE